MGKSGRAWLAGAAALALSVAAIGHAQQQQPNVSMAQPQVGLGLAIEEDPQGPRVGAVAPGGTAASMGVRAGDVLLKFGGRPISGPQSASDYVRSLRAGDPVSITVGREGRTVELRCWRAARDVERSGKPGNPRRGYP